MSSILTRSWAADVPAPRPDGPADPGVLVPFTAPQLSGVRARRHDAPVEYLLPNLAGGRGTYVAPWPMVAELTGPSLHDIVLAQRLAAQPLLSPAIVREQARLVALEGYAGRAAALEAARGRDSIAADAATLRGGLVSVLLHRAGLDRRGLPADPQTAPVREIARLIGWEPSQLDGVLGGIADAFLSVGTASAPRRMRRLLRLMTEVLPSMEEEQARLSHDHGTDAARPHLPSQLLRRLASDLAQAIAQANSFLSGIDRTLADPGMLIDFFRTDAIAAAAPVAAMDNLLDGWDRVCLSWQHAGTVSERHALIPIMGLYAGGRPQPDGGGKGSYAPPPFLDTGQGGAALISMRSRNEHVRARELALDHDPS
ncbi:hypothetical protein [Rhizosaccharibacter radicis]|uniref:Uncharacterized protein n=1 Tax=Rhizosaccharibacter radicis TaxID=2782605 RepID=A0ABT1VXU1_9PROT|nr:hypothetical protein [Acetobacteraceae bacterium KSS12]